MCRLRSDCVSYVVVAEVGTWWRGSRGRVESLSLQALSDDDFEPVDLQSRHHRRTAELVQVYADLPWGTTDATVIVRDHA